MDDEKNLTFIKIQKYGTIIGMLLIIVFIIYGYNIGIFSSMETFSDFLKSTGPAAPLIFTFIQCIQVIIPILPGAIGCPVGVVAFGYFLGFIYSYVGICLGSVISFIIARKYGKPIVRSVTSEKVYNKYIKWLESDKYDLFFAIAMFFPVAPDDFLCYLSGISKISLKKFTLIVLLCKPLSIFLYSVGLVGVIEFTVSLFH